MFIKYEKTYHVFPVTSKHNLDRTQLKRLLSGYGVIEEKMDGANVGIIRHSKGFSLQKRNSLVGPSVHVQFDRLYNWAHTDAYERIMSLPSGVLVYGEWLYATHHIYYDRLPEYFLVFDIRQGKK
jgi:ATP-dependent RNA circularization protein (DNA/RNA ligase family)